jgi:TatD DNase family protein
MLLVDTHTHLESFARRGELPSILARAQESGLVAMITIGTEPADWALYRDMAASHPGFVHHAVGLHPCSVDENWRAAVDQLAACFGAAPLPVAVGETGLDRFHLPKKDAAAAARILGWQRESFRVHIALARETGKPLVVHSRGAAAECIALLDEERADWQRVVFHCFADGLEVMAEINRRGGRGSFTGIASYKNADNVRAAAVAQGIERLMLETDAPYLAPEPLRGRTNESAFVVHTAAALARTFGMPVEQLAAATTANARAFFGI